MTCTHHAQILDAFGVCAECEAAVDVEARRAERERSYRQPDPMPCWSCNGHGGRHEYGYGPASTTADVYWVRRVVVCDCCHGTGRTKAVAVSSV